MKKSTLNVDSFLKVIQKHIDITELTAEIIKSFVERMNVSNLKRCQEQESKSRQSVYID
ncbi:DUF4368 domain-containing protein [Facklamia hominis]